MALDSRYIDLKTGLFAISKEDLKSFFNNYLSDLGSDYLWDASWDNMSAKDLWKKLNGKWANQKYIDLWRKAAQTFESNPGAFGRFTQEGQTYNETPRTVTDTPFRDNDALAANNLVSGDWRRGGYYNFDRGVDINGNRRPAYMTMEDGEYARTHNYTGTYNINGKLLEEETTPSPAAAPGRLQQAISFARGARNSMDSNLNRRDTRDAISEIGKNPREDYSRRELALVRRAANNDMNSRAVKTAFRDINPDVKLKRSQRKALAYAYNNGLLDSEGNSGSTFGLSDEDYAKFKTMVNTPYAKRGAKLIRRNIFIK